MSFLEIFQPGLQYLREERERQRMDIVQRPATGKGPDDGPLDLPEPPNPDALGDPGPGVAALPPDLTPAPENQGP
jgi:hypothetical protein